MEAFVVSFIPIKRTYAKARRHRCSNICALERRRFLVLAAEKDSQSSDRQNDEQPKDDSRSHNTRSQRTNTPPSSWWKKEFDGQWWSIPGSQPIPKTPPVGGSRSQSNVSRIDNKYVPPTLNVLPDGWWRKDHVDRKPTAFGSALRRRVASQKPDTGSSSQPKPTSTSTSTSDAPFPPLIAESSLVKTPPPTTPTPPPPTPAPVDKADSPPPSPSPSPSARSASLSDETRRQKAEMDEAIRALEKALEEAKHRAAEKKRNKDLGAGDTQEEEKAKASATDEKTESKGSGHEAKGKGKGTGTELDLKASIGQGTSEVEEPKKKSSTGTGAGAGAVESKSSSSDIDMASFFDSLDSLLNPLDVPAKAKETVEDKAPAKHKEAKLDGEAPATKEVKDEEEKKKSSSSSETDDLFAMLEELEKSLGIKDKGSEEGKEVEQVVEKEGKEKEEAVAATAAGEEDDDFFALLEDLEKGKGREKTAKKKDQRAEEPKDSKNEEDFLSVLGGLFDDLEKKFGDEEKAEGGDKKDEGSAELKAETKEEGQEEAIVEKTRKEEEDKTREDGEVKSEKKKEEVKPKEEEVDKKRVSDLDILPQPSKDGAFGNSDTSSWSRRDFMTAEMLEEENGMLKYQVRRLSRVQDDNLVLREAVRASVGALREVVGERGLELETLKAAERSVLRLRLTVERLRKIEIFTDVISNAVSKLDLLDVKHRALMSTLRQARVRPYDAILENALWAAEDWQSVAESLRILDTLLPELRAAMEMIRVCEKETDRMQVLHSDLIRVFEAGQILLETAQLEQIASDVGAPTKIGVAHIPLKQAIDTLRDCIDSIEKPQSSATELDVKANKAE